jgi:phosphoribosylglycinamide formyltransferase-1
MIGVLVSGEGTNLQALLDAGLPVAAVAANKHGIAALARAGAAGVPAAVFALDDYPDRAARDAAMAVWLAEQGASLVVSAGFSHLLTPGFLRRFRTVNVHPSLLPAFPGLGAVEAALAAGAAETGVTVFDVDGGIDTGPVLAQERVEIQEDDTVESLLARIHAVEHRLLPAVVRTLLA